MKTVRILAAAAAAGLLAACGGGGGGSKPAVVPQPPAQSGGNTLSPSSTTFNYMSRALNGLSRIGPAQVGSMKVDVQMTLRDAPGLQAYAAAVGDPSNGLYRHFLTPDEIGARFGANDADWKAAIAYFKSAGLQVVGWRQKSVLRVVGPQAKVEQAFGTTFAFYNGPSGKVLGPTSTPHFATPLAVHSVTHLVYSPKWMKRNSIVIPP
ncbi:MAG: hypothetical protein JO186_00130, partial [Actinobacteria bacterium]|nr:hypothetical protein [Actinomycetota bacterium]